MLGSVDVDVSYGAQPAKLSFMVTQEQKSLDLAVETKLTYHFAAHLQDIRRQLTRESEAMCYIILWGTGERWRAKQFPAELIGHCMIEVVQSQSGVWAKVMLVTYCEWAAPVLMPVPEQDGSV